MYALMFVVNLGSSKTGLTLNAKLFDETGVQVGATITTGFVEIGNGVYSYYHQAIPNGHTGTFIMYDSADADTVASFSVEPSLSGASIGAIEFTYTVDDGSLPIAGATVWISTDSAGNNAIFSGVTDAFGVLRNPATSAKPFLDPGTYYFWVQAEGYSFSNPDTEVVS